MKICFRDVSFIFYSMLFLILSLASVWRKTNESLLSCNNKSQTVKISQRISKFSKTKTVNYELDDTTDQTEPYQAFLRNISYQSLWMIECQIALKLHKQQKRKNLSSFTIFQWFASAKNKVHRAVVSFKRVIKFTRGRRWKEKFKSRKIREFSEVESVASWWWIKVLLLDIF